MTGLAERLDTLAREATGAVGLMPAELAARARRRHRIRTSLVAGALAASAAVATLYAVTASPGPRKVVRVATPSGAASTTTPPARGVWAELAAIARRQASQFGDASPSGARAVATDLAGFQRATGTSGNSLSFDPAVYFIQMTGEFTAWSYLGPGPDFPHGTVLGVAVEQATMSVVGTSLGTRPVDLAALGPVHGLDLTGGPAGSSSPGSAATVTVPDIVGSSEAAASAVLGNVGLNARFTTAASTNAPVGTVVTESPAAGSLVVAGSTVSVIVSSGPSAAPNS